MKNLKLFGLQLILILAIMSCSKDNKTGKKVPGDWKVNKIIIGTNTITNNHLLPTITFTEGTANCLGDGTYTCFDGSKATINWQVQQTGKELCISKEYNNLPDSLKSYAELELMYYGVNNRFTIIEISKTNLVIFCKECGYGISPKEDVTIEMNK